MRLYMYAVVEGLWSFILITIILRTRALSTLPKQVSRPKPCSMASSVDDHGIQLGDFHYQQPSCKDISTCFKIESNSYPSDEAASFESLQYRQEKALPYFLCALVDDKIVGFICATRTNQFEEESMSTHDNDGKLLAIHSVVVEESYRRKGIATAMLKAYLDKVQRENNGSIQAIVLLAKEHLLGFYVKCGFVANRASPIIHGQGLWFELEKTLVRTTLDEGESWFCKTEQFKKPYPEVKPYLEEHKLWVLDMRKSGHCMTSGYRVDEKGRPGGGGLMFLAAKTYDEAQSIVLKDPLVANDCVDWVLNGWNRQVGDIEIR
eukprot:CAMPEP_0194259834 /NCGR_PEP_ID=MMETSP0158-20130606/44471_1 /TAXON_ID=33649 /ORGANISM="Thalassionema nitzschioides, Strain L26-B" /LENGTH=319 /DNA_ID=CAMNT_0038999779 /DNA_START=15 /DNA_END=977 /DNA_ORIENTATION=+